MRDVLVTGTDTGVGKTVIAAALVKALRAQGIRALGFKPAETGLTPGEVPDSRVLARESGETPQLASPLLQLTEALAPAVAAERAGMPFLPEDIERRVKLLRRAGYSLVIEGAGGVLVPFAWLKGDAELLRLNMAKKIPVPFYTVLDLAERCGADAIVVGRAGLGTLNHMAMTVAILRSREIPIRAVVLNGRPSSPNVAESTNPAALARMIPDVRIIEVPQHPAGDEVALTVPYLIGLV